MQRQNPTNQMKFALVASATWGLRTPPEGEYSKNILPADMINRPPRGLEQTHSVQLLCSARGDTRTNLRLTVEPSDFLIFCLATTDSSRPQRVGCSGSLVRISIKYRRRARLMTNTAKKEDIHCRHCCRSSFAPPESNDIAAIQRRRWSPNVRNVDHQIQECFPSLTLTAGLLTGFLLSIGDCVWMHFILLEH